MQIDSDAAIKLPESQRMALVARPIETMPAENVAMSLDDPDLAREIERRFVDASQHVRWRELRAER
jgi:hypothetical protein